MNATLVISENSENALLYKSPYLTESQTSVAKNFLFKNAFGF